jgi:hypothetical protein
MSSYHSAQLITKKGNFTFNFTHSKNMTDVINEPTNLQTSNMQWAVLYKTWAQFIFFLLMDPSLKTYKRKDEQDNRVA